MKTLVTFRAKVVFSELGAFGKRAALARYLVDQLVDGGYTCSTTRHTYNASGFGCVINKRRFEVAVSMSDSQSNEWLLTTRSALTWLQHTLLRRNDTNEHVALNHALHRSMKQNARFSDLRWYTQEEWNAPLRNQWSPYPDFSNARSSV